MKLMTVDFTNSVQVFACSRVRTGSTDMLVNSCSPLKSTEGRMEKDSFFSRIACVGRLRFRRSTRPLR
jgi:hypothetical protein